MALATRSRDFPTQHPLQPALGSALDDAFVTKISSGGTALIYSSFLGGSGLDTASGITVDGEGNAYVTGTTYSANFPTRGAVQRQLGNSLGMSDAFVTRVDGSGALGYSSYLGGEANESGAAITVGAADTAYVTGQTSSQNLPTLMPLLDRSGDGLSDGFVAVIAEGRQAGMGSQVYLPLMRR